MKSLEQLQQLVDELRDPHNGDPWIKAQTFKSLITLTIEEAYEFADSVDQNDYTAICDELGDLLLHVFLYAKLAEEKGHFNLTDVAKNAIDKQQRRKLYFKNPEEISAQEAIEQWEQRKQKEREQKGFESALDGIARSIPGINRSLKLQCQAARTGFDWPDKKPIFEKLHEEISEVKMELSQAIDKDKLTEEMGDLFFTCVNLARHLDLDPELAIRHANNKFENRFRLLEQEFKKQNKDLHEASLEEMDEVWETIKNQKT